MSDIVSLLKLDGSTLTSKDGETKGPLEGVELLSLYFSAHWCPPCRGFTPQLVDCYNKVNAGKKRWEILFVSSDRDGKSFSDYFASMPWLAVKFEDDDDKSNLMDKYHISGIPALVCLNPTDGSVTTKDGRGLVSSDREGSKFPWK